MLIKKASPDDYKQRIIRVSRYTVIVMIILAIGILTPYHAFFLGLLLGGAASLINVIHTGWKINKIAEIASQSINKDNQKPQFASAGLTTRFLVAMLVVVIALRFPNQINIVSSLIGLFIAQTILVVDGIIHKSNY